MTTFIVIFIVYSTISCAILYFILDEIRNILNEKKKTNEKLDKLIGTVAAQSTVAALFSEKLRKDINKLIR